MTSPRRGGELPAVPQRQVARGLAGGCERHQVTRRVCPDDHRSEHLAARQAERAPSGPAGAAARAELPAVPGRAVLAADEDLEAAVGILGERQVRPQEDLPTRTVERGPVRPGIRADLRASPDLLVLGHCGDLEGAFGESLVVAGEKVPSSRRPNGCQPVHSTLSSRPPGRARRCPSTRHASRSPPVRIGILVPAEGNTGDRGHGRPPTSRGAHCALREQESHIASTLRKRTFGQNPTSQSAVGAVDVGPGPSLAADVLVIDGVAPSGGGPADSSARSLDLAWLGSEEPAVGPATIRPESSWPIGAPLGGPGQPLPTVNLVETQLQAELARSQGT